MLNRRILRVKAMQALYGYFVTADSLVEVAKASLEDYHSLDPAKHDFTEKASFEKRKRTAVRLFLKNMDKTQVEGADNAEPEILSSVNATLQNFHLERDKEAKRRSSDMMKEARNLENAYLKLLMLPIELEHREKLEREKDLKAKKSIRNYPFVDHPIIGLLKEADVIKKAASDPSLSWANDTDTIEVWYKKQIRTHEFMDGYFNEEVDDLDLVLEFYKKVLFKNEVMVSYLENEFLHWVENQPILKSMLVKTLKSLTHEDTFLLAELTKNGEEDFEFLQRLFDDVIEHDDYLEGLIASRTKNWEVDRIAVTDRVILKLALVEMMNSPSIPVKVSINEAIEISKIYSTPKSKQFINGVLDVLSNELTSRGKIRKSGRGLIDNQ